jgi:hypothetical protein
MGSVWRKADLEKTRRMLILWHPTEAGKSLGPDITELGSCLIGSIYSIVHVK